MAIGITPDDVYEWTFERERLLPAPQDRVNQLSSPADVEIYAVRMEAWRQHNAAAQAAIDAGTVTVWRLRTISSRDQSRLIQMAGQSRDGWEFEALRVGLAGWTNWKDRNGKPIEVATESVPDLLGRARSGIVTFALLDRIPFNDVVQLARAIISNRVTEEELGNS